MCRTPLSLRTHLIDQGSPFDDVERCRRSLRGCANAWAANGNAGPSDAPELVHLTALDLKEVEGSNPSSLALGKWAVPMFQTIRDVQSHRDGAFWWAKVMALESRTCCLRSRQSIKGMVHLPLFDAVNCRCVRFWKEHRNNRHHAGLLVGIEILSSGRSLVDKRISFVWGVGAQALPALGR